MLPNKTVWIQRLWLWPWGGLTKIISHLPTKYLLRTIVLSLSRCCLNCILKLATRNARHFQIYYLKAIYYEITRGLKAVDPIFHNTWQVQSSGFKLSLPNPLTMHELPISIKLARIKKYSVKFRHVAECPDDLWPLESRSNS